MYTSRTVPVLSGRVLDSLNLNWIGPRKILVLFRSVPLCPSFICVNPKSSPILFRFVPEQCESYSNEFQISPVFSPKVPDSPFSTCVSYRENFSVNYMSHRQIWFYLGESQRVPSLVYKSPKSPPTLI